MQPKILIASTTWFAMPARVTLAFLKCGAEVSAICPNGSPIQKLKSVTTIMRYSQVDPLSSLSKAMLAVQPDLIIPCDDRVVEHLHSMFANSSQSKEYALCAPLIERSLGDPAHFATSSSRGDLLRLAEQEGIQIPVSGTVGGLLQLRQWLTRNGYPAVLKIDGSWAGSGVRVVKTWEQARKAFEALTSPLSLVTRLRCLCSHDLFPIFSQNMTNREEVTIQSFIEGRSVNAMFACWQGEVLDHLSVEALYSVDPLGSATIIKTIQNEEMAAAGKIIARHLGITGFFGIDFIISSAGEVLHLIELNPRITQVGHLEPGGKQNLIATLCRRWRGDTPPVEVPFTEEMIAFFPHSLRCEPNLPLLTLPNLRHDIPVEEPELVLELSRKPWNSRHLSSMIFRAFSRLLTWSRPSHRVETMKLGRKDSVDVKMPTDVS